MTTRRQTLSYLAASIAGSPLVFAAETPPKIWRVGFLALGRIDRDESNSYYGGFRQGMSALGYIEGKNVKIEWRSAEGRVPELAALADELVKMKVDVIVTGCAVSGKAAQMATTTIPIVLAESGDPIIAGVANSLARPGRNITGLYSLAGDLAIKKLELLTKVVPGLSRVVVLVNGDNPGGLSSFQKMQSGSRAMGVTTISLLATNPREIEAAMASAKQQDVGAVIILADQFFQQQNKQLVQLLAMHKLPSAAGYSEFVDAGGLMSYGSSQHSQFRRAAAYVERIFKGASPAEMPIEQPMTLDVVLNEKTATALGLTIPRSVLISASRIVR